MRPRRRAAAVALALGVVAVVPACGAASGSPSANPTDADRRYLAVLARHVRHEADLAEAASARLVAVDADADAAASRLEAGGHAQADALDALLRQWGVDSTAEADLFAGAVGIGTLPPGTVVYGCSLAGPLDDVSQVKAAAPEDLARRYSQLAMTAAVEGRALAATDRADLVDASRHVGDDVDAYQRDVLRAVAPWLPATDRPYASAGGVASHPPAEPLLEAMPCLWHGLLPRALGHSGEVAMLGRFFEAADPSMVVVTAAADGDADGCLVGFHSQVSIDPERYVVWISTANHTYEVAARTDVLAVHLLGADDHGVAELFGGLTADDADKLERCGWEPGPAGVPLLDKAPARLVGRVVDVQVGVGDHVGFVLEPIEVQTTEDEGSLRYSDVTDIEPGHPVSNG